MAREIRFNTGRGYSVDGQWIAVWERDDGSILFADLTRGVYGHIDAPRFPALVETDEGLQRYVMGKYDRVEYSVDSYAHGFYMGFH